MADVKISQLPVAATPLTGSEVFPLVQSSVTVQSSLNNIASSILASDTNFTANGTNAVARTVQGKLRDIVSVKDFGAVGDGVTNDRVAINNAIASLSATGGTVFFPAGTYLVSGAASDRKSTRLNSSHT